MAAASLCAIAWTGSATGVLAHLRARWRSPANAQAYTQTSGNVQMSKTGRASKLGCVTALQSGFNKLDRSRFVTLAGRAQTITAMVQLRMWFRDFNVDCLRGCAATLRRINGDVGRREFSLAIALQAVQTPPSPRKLLWKLRWNDKAADCYERRVC